MSAHTDTYLNSDDGRVSESEGGYFVNFDARNVCCGRPYPVLVFDDGREACGGCFRVLVHADACDCVECESNRLADDAADTYAGR